ncbi:MAG TPA: hypothetical protein DGT21_16085, partial [Armatimonadetes bacterium]|nr:hypothetical protein [Armatimonadota bacterium]
MCPRTNRRRRADHRAKPPPAAVALLCCLLLTLPAALPAADSAAPANPFADAKALYTAAEYQKALDAFAALIDAAPDDATRAECTLWQAHCLNRLGHTDEAIAAYQKARDFAGDTLIGVQALEYLAALHLSKGDYEQAEDFFDQAIKAYPDAYTAYLEAAGSARYTHNRAELDVLIEHSIGKLTTLADSLKAGGQTQAAALIYRKLAIEHAYRYGWQARSLQAADTLREIGADAAAVPFYLRVLSASGDRAYTPKAITSHNQPHLDAVCKPVPAEMATQAVTGLNACLPEQYRLSEERLAQFSSA